MIDVFLLLVAPVPQNVCNWFYHLWVSFIREHECMKFCIKCYKIDPLCLCRVCVCAWICVCVCVWCVCVRMHAGVCVCLCVSERERERERELWLPKDWDVGLFLQSVLAELQKIHKPGTHATQKQTNKKLESKDVGWSLLRLIARLHGTINTISS